MNLLARSFDMYKNLNTMEVLLIVTYNCLFILLHPFIECPPNTIGHCNLCKSGRFLIYYFNVYIRIICLLLEVIQR